jgi:DNA repair photolyase
MPFDFNKEPLRLYGIAPQSPFPVEVSIFGYCRMACSYCFSNRNRDANQRELNPVNSTPALLRKLDRVMQDEFSPLGFFLRERYPVVFSNTTDGFQRDERTHRSSEAFLAWCQANRVPVFIQTRGADLLLDEWARYSPLLEPGRVVVYVSICHMNDRDRRFHEPGAPSLAARWELVHRLTSHGVPVIVAANPFLAEWIPDPHAFCLLAADAGAKGVWLEALHLTDAQGDCLARPYRDLLFRANLAPQYLIGSLKRWYAACEEYGLDFFPTPKWDAYFGCKAKHPECVDPQWLGGKTLSFNFDIVKALTRKSEREGGALVALDWPTIAAAMELSGLPNVELDTADFWYPFNASVKADSRAWRSRLGKRAPLYEIIRYFWNHPWECQNLLWYTPFLQALYDDAAEDYITDDDGDLIGVWNPGIKHHGLFTVDINDEPDRPVVALKRGDLCPQVVVVDGQRQRDAGGDPCAEAEPIPVASLVT